MFVCKVKQYYKVNGMGITTIVPYDEREEKNEQN